MTSKPTLCFWFSSGADEAATFYAATFPDSAVKNIHRAPADFPNGKKGDVLSVEFSVMGLDCVGLNGGPAFTHSEAFSLQIFTDTQEETDKYWHAITQNGGSEGRCGWCKDRWGLSWQIIPRALTRAMRQGGAGAGRAMAAMQKMNKIDIATIEAAAKGDGA